MARTKVCDLAELAWLSATTPDRWIGAREFARLVEGQDMWSECLRRRWTYTLEAAATLDWPLERRTAYAPTPEGGARGKKGTWLYGSVQVKPLSTALVLDAHLAAYKAGTLYPGFGLALAALAEKYPWAAYSGDPMDKAAIAAGLRAPTSRRWDEVKTIHHEARLGRLTLREEDGCAIGVWQKEGEECRPA